MAAREAGWGNAEHRRQWVTTLETYAYPTLGALPVPAIDTALVVKCLEPIWNAKRTTAERVRGQNRSGTRLGNGAKNQNWRQPRPLARPPRTSSDEGSGSQRSPQGHALCRDFGVHGHAAQTAGSDGAGP